MAIIALASAKGSPGVTTTCLALALTWPRPVLLVEADPAGGDVMAGYVRAELRSDRGLAYLAVAARRDTLDNELRAQVVSIAPEKASAHSAPVARWLLPGVTDPVESAGVAPSWPRLSDFFVALSRGGVAQQSTGREPLDVIVDCGRLISTYPPLTVMTAADLVLIVVRASLRSASSAAPVVATVRREIVSGGGDARRMGLLVVEGGEYRTSDLGRALGVPVIATLPWREKDAAALSDGIGKVLDNAPLMRAARKTGEALLMRASRPPEVDAGGYPAPDAQLSAAHAPSVVDSPPGVMRR
ncbi:MAG TPA: ParA family protein [Micromonosporaceae bacterium]|nr:ParA family protein [Micromonosporaceae bacterium]